MSRMIIDRDVISSKLKGLGLSRGDTLEVHSSLSNFGYVKGGANTVIESILDCVGPSGTVIMPAFLLSHPLPIETEDQNREVNLKLKILHNHQEPSGMGLIADLFKKRKDVMVTNGLFALAIWGEKANSFLDGDFKTIVESGCKSLLLGVSYNRCSPLHLSENVLLPKKLRDYFTKPDYIRQNYSSDYYIGYRDSLEEPFIKAGQIAEKKNVVKSIKIGNATCRLFNPQDIITILRDLRRTRPYWLFDIPSPERI